MPRRQKNHPANRAKNPGPPNNRSKRKMKRWNTVDDIPLDEEDEFHANRDQILLDGDEMQYDEDDFGAEDEVFALNGVGTSSSEENEDEDQEGDGDAMEVDGGPSTSSVTKGSRTKSTKAPKPSALASDSDEGEDESEEETWGAKKSAYYSANDAHFDSEDEEANELEEKEARRLQMKAREGMGDEDFGLDNLQALEDGRMEPDVIDGLVDDPVVTLSLPQDKTSLLRHLEKNSPETLALARDWDDIAVTVAKAGQRLKKMQSENPDAISLGMVHLHYQTLLTYATTLAFYLHLRSTPKYAAHPDLVRSHPVLERLLALKQSLSTLEDLDFDMSDSQSGEDGRIGDDFDESDEDEDLDLDDEEIFDLFDRTKGGKKKKPRLEQNELQELLRDAELDISDLTPMVNGAASPEKKRKKAGKDPISYNQEEVALEPPKKKQKTGKKDQDSAKPRTAVFDLVEPEFEYSTSKTVPSSSVPDAADSFGEQTILQSFDAADKKARKKSLRFHTSKIENAANRRDKGVRNLMGGDDDIPYKERKKQKEIREAKQIARGKGMGGDDLSDGDPEVEMDVDFAGFDGDISEKQSRKKRGRVGLDEDDEDVDPGEYYSLVERSARERKEKKKAEYDEAKAAERDVLMAPETADGPRALTRAILKNRGLTPHRTKSVRNPRVKKRQKFEKAKKKVSSQKAVYKGGIGDAANYGGEKSGISKVVKAVRL